MKKMNKLVALTVAAVVMSSMAAMAVNTPDNVGNVTLLGNIVANSPMWQWTVNDYPGPRLDAKPSEATTENGVTKYKLVSQPFIAVSGYLPSTTSVVSQNVTGLGNRDITTFTDADGNTITNLTNLPEPMSVSFTIKATSQSASGQTVDGKLRIKSTEIRGMKTITYHRSNNSVLMDIFVFASNVPAHTDSEEDSCFVGTNGVLPGFTGQVDNPGITGVSSTAAAEFFRALDHADESGVVKFSDAIKTGSNIERNRITSSAQKCHTLTRANINKNVNNVKLVRQYTAAAHIIELNPLELMFSTPVQGTWNATLNVTAYQM